MIVVPGFQLQRFTVRPWQRELLARFGSAHELAIAFVLSDSVAGFFSGGLGRGGYKRPRYGCSITTVSRGML